MQKYISLDIDGILNDYPDCWVRYVNITKNKKYQSKEEALSDLGEEEYKNLKRSYRNSDYKANLEVCAEPLEFCHYLIDKGYKIIISTSRPLNHVDYPNLFDLTYNWLSRNNIPFTELLFKEKTEAFLKKLPRLSFHIDDDAEYANFFALHGITSFLYLRNNFSSEFIHEKVVTFTSFKDLAKIV